MAKHEKFRYKSSLELISHLQSLGISLPWSDDIGVLLETAEITGIPVPNRLVVQPMEGFDSGRDGTPGDLAFRRYGRYAKGGSGMIWFEATSVMPGGRSNPHQMMITRKNAGHFEKLVRHVRKTAMKKFGSEHRPFLVIQLTHSGRYSNPGGEFKAKVFSENPYLDHRQPSFFSDHELDAIKSAFIRTLDLAEEIGFDAVDIKACHGYLLHEMLFARDRTDSLYGGSFEGRTRFLREVLCHPAGIVKVMRLGAFDLIPHPYGFGMSQDGSGTIELSEVRRLITEFGPLVPLWNITAGVPRHAPYVGRPADRPAGKSGQPPEHPLESIARLIRVTGELQQSFPDLFFVGSGYSWLRQYFPNVGAGVLHQGQASFIGLGRSSFAYPSAPRDLMKKGALDPKKVCTTCSKCTELMRSGQPTGCPVRDKSYRA